MSHDRGCPCGREPYDYNDCTVVDCHKRNMWGKYSTPVNRMEGELVSLNRFHSSIQIGAINDEDGFGYPAKNGMMDTSNMILTSRPQDIPKDATHILWIKWNKEI